jgi:hypothetical protein
MAPPLPLILGGIQIGAGLLNNLFRGRDVDRFEEEVRRQTARSNLVAALTRGRVVPQVSAVPRESFFTRLTGGVSTGAGIANQALGLISQGRLFDEQLRGEQLRNQVAEIGRDVTLGHLAAQGAQLPQGVPRAQAPAPQALTPPPARGGLTPQASRVPGITPQIQPRALPEPPVDLSDVGRQSFFASLAGRQQQQQALEAQRIAAQAQAQREAVSQQLEVGRFLLDVEEFNQSLRETITAVPGLSPKDQAIAEDRLRNEFVDLSKNFIEVRDAFSRIQAVAQNPSPQGDIAMVFNYMKMLDPRSTVREGEAATVANAAGVPDIWRNLYNRVLTGQTLGPPQRTDILSQARNLFDAQLRVFEPVQTQFAAMAERRGLDVRNVILDLNIPTATRSFTVPRSLQAPPANQGFNFNLTPQSMLNLLDEVERSIR